MWNVKKISLVIVGAIFISVFIFINKSTSNKPRDLKDLNIQELTEIRDKEIDNNLELLKEYGATENELKERKDEILTFDLGLVGFVDNNYKDFTEKDKMIKQIKLVKHANSNKDVMYPADEYYAVLNENYQVRAYLLKNGKSRDLISYENLKFLINNIEDLSKYIDYNTERLVDYLNPYYTENLSKEQKSSLIDEWKKVYSSDDLNPKLKKEIKKTIK